MTDPLGKHWSQPPLSAILVDDTHAVMAEATMNRLSDYSHTVPTGCYPGKMWRSFRHDIKPDGAWYLRWYGPVQLKDGVEYCSVEYREILLLN